MSIESRSRQYGAVFDNWHIGKKLGSGSNGQSAVFELYRDNNGWRERSALKVISLIEERGRLDTMPASQFNEYTTAVGQQRKDAEKEVHLMYELKGKTNIVGYEDYKFFDWSDESGFGTDLLIRMELLTDLRSVIKNLLKEDKCLTEREIIKIGKDICQALVICHSKGILHRDIKPENIFISDDGDYKLGDFGVSRILSNASAALASTGIGTPAYSAPEQFAGKYDHRVDIYSLGLVLYELSNQNRLPFATSGYIRQEDIQKRQMGIPLPQPNGISEGFWRVLQKACAYKAADRYGTAQEFLEDLYGLSGKKIDPPPPVKKKRKKWIFIGAIAVIVIALFFLIREEHEHVWSDATCTAPRTCKDCGATEGSELGHQWVEANCTSPAICAVCKKTQGNAYGHQWIAADYLSPQTCSVCGKTEGRSLGYNIGHCSVTSNSNEKNSNSDVALGTWIDKFGQTHSSALRFWIADFGTWSDTEWIEYDIDGQFQQLDIKAMDEIGSTAGTTFRVMVYADGELIYTSNWIGSDVHSVQDTIDIQNCSRLRIECTTDSQAYCYCIVQGTLFN